MLSVSLSVWVSNRDHWSAIRELRHRDDIKIVFSREQPSFIDRVLGDFRFDNVKEITPGGDLWRTSAVSPVTIQSLRGLERFSFEQVNVARTTNSDISCLNTHTKTLKFLDLGYSHIQPPLLAEFTQLEELATQSPVNFATLKSRETLKTVRCCNWQVSNLAMCKSLIALSLEVEDLDCEFVKTELSPLKRLRQLGLHGRSKIDIEWIGDAGLNLKTLCVSDVDLVNAGSISRLNDLEVLNFVQCEFDESPTFSKLEHLQFLFLYSSGITDLSWVQGCGALKYLHLGFGFRRPFDLSPFAVVEGPLQEYRVDVGLLETLPSLEAACLGGATVEFEDVPRLDNLKYLACDMSDHEFERLAERNPDLKKWGRNDTDEVWDYLISRFGKATVRLLFFVDS